MFSRILISLSVVLLLVAASNAALAQGKFAPVKGNTSLIDLVNRAREGRSAANPETLARVREGYAAVVARDESLIGAGDLVGTWNCYIPASDGGGLPFEALQTFNADGTFVETSSLLGTGTEGPAHGVWQRTLGGFVLTFELFVFDPMSGESVSRVRVRNLIRINNRNKDRFVSYQVVDFIEPDGNLIEGIDSGIFTGDRMALRGV